MAIIRNKYGRIIEVEGKASSGANSKSIPIGGEGSSKGLKPSNMSTSEEEKPSSFDVTLIKGGSKVSISGTEATVNR